MLNIPAEVKSLFQRDDIYKNFHVHFPGGEWSDLNNGDIVSESVSFTESLCSQQAFRFGLTEASELKFTCVNVPNIRGVTLEACIEIDVATLGAAWIASHQPSGAEAFLDPQVCTYGGRDLYRVPYGVFIVDTCPRNHETMYKRDVTAYTERMTDALVNPGQRAVTNTFYPVLDTYTPCVKPLALANLLNGSPASITGYGYVADGLSVDRSTVGYGKGLTLPTTLGTTINISVMVEYDEYRPSGTAYAESDIFTINWGTYDESSYINALAVILDTNCHIDLDASGFDSFQDIARTMAGSAILPTVGASYTYSGQSEYAVTALPQGTNIIYPHVISGDMAYPGVPKRALIISGGTTYGTVTIDPVTFTRYRDTSGDYLATLELTFNSTLQSKASDSGLLYDGYSFTNAFSLSGLVSGYLELLCRFGSPARTGGIEITGLDNTSPVSILPGNYSELWYDETTISPIGYALVKFKGSDGNEQDITVQIGTGLSVYDLTENEVIRNTVFTVSDAEASQGITIESKIIDFLNTVFTPNIPDMSFVPIELTKQGLPYLEAGDAIEITTGDGQTVPSFILRQTISGIQFLTADVESANGEAIEVLT